MRKQTKIGLVLVLAIVLTLNPNPPMDGVWEAC